MKAYNNLNELNFLSILLVSPAIKLGDIEYNQKIIVNEIQKHPNINLFVFPELSLTGATCGDYFLMNKFSSLIDNAINNILEASSKYHSTIIFGTPFLINGKLLNCGLFISDGKLLGIVPKEINNR
jgi:NAD+ synthase (glutamine-hydrolysing)